MTKTKWIYVIGSIIIGFISLVGVFFGLMTSGIISTEQPRVVIAIASAEKEYDGTPLTCHDWTVVDGELKKGHVANVVVSGTATNVGVYDNHASVTISDHVGADVTEDYDIEIQIGKLTVYKRIITLVTKGAEKVYDGTPLSKEEYTCEGEMVDGHEIEVTFLSSLTEAGSVDNKATALVYADKENVTHNYDVRLEMGALTVYQREITVRSESGDKQYDGEPLTCDKWELVSINDVLEGHKVYAKTSGEQLSPGSSKNVFGQVIVMDETDPENPKDVTRNYNVKEQCGTLTVFGSNANQGGGNGGGGSGGLEDGSHENDDTVFLKLLADISGSLYLKDSSYGKYTGNSWEAATPYDKLLDEEYAYSYLFSILLENAKANAHTITIQDLTGLYHLPYYIARDDGDYKIQTNDAAYQGGNPAEYSLYYYLYDFNTNGIEGLSGASLEAYESLAYEYEQFVRANYLDVPESTLAYFEQLIQELNFNAEDADIVRQVAQYIKGAAKYDLEYDKALDKEADIAVSFLRDYKVGVCRHYASAATLMFRALGIPARYTTGFLASTQEGEWVEVLGKQGHAWVEVYLSGYGWVQIEVTGSDGQGGSGGGGQGGENEGEGGGQGGENEGEGGGQGGSGGGQGGENEGEGGGQGGSGGEGPGGSGGKVGLDGGLGGELTESEKQEAEEEKIFSFIPDADGAYYFRIKSFGNYSFNGWEEGTVYDVNGLEVNPLYFVALALEEAGYPISQMTIQAIVSDMYWMLPYFGVDDGSGILNDVIIEKGAWESYTLQMYVYDYLSNTGLSLQGTQYEELENAYREFVYKNYLDLPDTTKQAMEKVIADAGLDKNSQTIIADVAKYISGYVPYDFLCPEYQGDYAIYFFEEAESAVCRYYATAATAVYRTLGIPARYVIGYKGEGVAGEESFVTALQAHAWVEVYVDGLGWIPVEVTGGGPGGSGQGGNGGSGGNQGGEGGENEKLIKLTITPITVAQQFDGSNSAKAVDKISEGKELKTLLSKGYTYEVSVSGERTTYGKGQSTVDIFRLYAPDKTLIYEYSNGQVTIPTNEFNVAIKQGTLHLYIRKLTFTSTSLEKVYDGEPLLPDGKYSWEGTLESGHKLEGVEFLREQLTVGKVANSFNVKLVDENGQDVTDWYLIEKKTGTLTVYHREIIITAGSQEFTYTDGSETYRCETYTVSSEQNPEQPLAVGHTLSAAMGEDCYIEERGIVANEIDLDSIKIIDENGEDVTSNYSIETKSGLLIMR